MILLSLLALVASAYLFFGLGVAITLKETHRSRNMLGGPPFVYYAAALLLPLSALADLRRAGRIRKEVI